MRSGTMKGWKVYENNGGNRISIHHMLLSDASPELLDSRGIQPVFKPNQHIHAFMQNRNDDWWFFI